MAKGGKGAKGGGKDERRAKKATQNRDREHRRESRRALDRSELTQFAVLLKGNSLLLREVERDGNCFFRSLADQIEDCEHNHAEYRVKVMDYVERHQEDFEPFFSFGEGEDEDDADFSEYIARMRLDGEWAGNYEIIAAVSLSRLSLSRLSLSPPTRPPTHLPTTAQPGGCLHCVRLHCLPQQARALDVHIMVHQYKMPAYRTESSNPDAPVVHLSYHDGTRCHSNPRPPGRLGPGRRPRQRPA